MDNSSLKIIVEDKIPFIRGLLEPYGKVEYLPSDAITSDAVSDANALIVRTRNRCDKNLLENSNCEFIATATIGLDHIDLPYCGSKGIKVVNAPGCNAPAVAQYVLASILVLYPNPAGMTIGIVGVGHIGTIVARWARSLGMNVLLNDPPREREEKSDLFVDLNTIAEKSDIITLHTPYTKEGMDSTHHLIDDDFIGKLKLKPLLINAARGPIVDTSSILKAMDSGIVSNVVIDCWEGEPNINRQLLERAFIATPHIAGYSLEGKIRATRIAVEKLTEHFNLLPIQWENPLPATPISVSKETICESYDPMKDTSDLKLAPENFETLRNDYSYRHEPL